MSEIKVEYKRDMRGVNTEYHSDYWSLPGKLQRMLTPMSIRLVKPIESPWYRAAVDDVDDWIDEWAKTIPPGNEAAVEHLKKELRRYDERTKKTGRDGEGQRPGVPRSQQ